MLGVKGGHTIYCETNCKYVHHEVLLKLLACKQGDSKTFEVFKLCVKNMASQGWVRDSEIPDSLEWFRFPLVHWAAVYGKLHVLKWMIQSDFDVGVRNRAGENALHRLVACQAHERALHKRKTNSRYSLSSITYMFTKVVDMLTDKDPQMLLWYDYGERNTPLLLCLKLFIENLKMTRLSCYYETIFNILCHRLLLLIKKGKINMQFARKALNLKDSDGDTIWHVAARTKSTKMLDGVMMLVDNVKGVHLSMTNRNGHTPCMVALKSAFAQYASFLQERVGPILIVPMVKTELLPEMVHCLCEQKKLTENTESDYSHSIPESFDFSYPPQLDTSLCTDNTQFQDISIVDEQSFTEPLKMFTIVDQPHVVLTNPDVPYAMVHQDSGVDSETDMVSVQTACPVQEDIVVEKQIDLVVSVTEPPKIGNTSGITKEAVLSECLVNNMDMVDDNKDNATAVNDVLMQNNTEQNANDFDPEEHKVSSSNTDEAIDEDITTVCTESTTTKNVNLTPVLLIKLLSEPDVSARFQSLLKDVITDDSVKVDSTQTTLLNLNNTKDKLQTDIDSNRESLKEIACRKQSVIDDIQRLQVKLDTLQTSEDVTIVKMNSLKKEHEDICLKIKDCESTCDRLKRRLSDCNGALTGLSPKQPKLE